MSSIFVDFYTRLFTSSNAHDIDRVLEGVNKVVSDNMNAELLMPYSKEEVDVAIKQMAPLKAPSPDGMLPIFYQSFWQNVGSKVTEAILSCLKSDDCLLFCRSNAAECQKIQLLLDWYEAASGQQLNKAKTTIQDHYLLYLKYFCRGSTGD